MLSSLGWCLYENRCSLTQSCYLEMLLNLDDHLSSDRLRTFLKDAAIFLLRRGDEVTIGNEDLTRVLTRLLVRLADRSLLIKLFLFIEQTQTELVFVETLLDERQAFASFQSDLRQWIVDLLLTMDLFNEQLFTRVSGKRGEKHLRQRSSL